MANYSRLCNQIRIIQILDRLTCFFNANKLTVNKLKTVLQELMLKQKRCKIQGSPPYLVTLDDKGDIKVVKAAKSSILLGGSIQNDLQWQSHLETGEAPLLSALRQKLGALKHIGGNIPPKSKLLLINGMLLSKILYLLPLYGSTHKKYLRKLQVVMNDAIRFFTGFNRRTNTQILMEAVGWLDINKLIEFHSLLLAWKIIRLGSPSYLAEKN